MKRDPDHRPVAEDIEAHGSATSWADNDSTRSVGRYPRTWRLLWSGCVDRLRASDRCGIGGDLHQLTIHMVNGWSEKDRGKKSRSCGDHRLESVRVLSKRRVCW